MCGICGIIGSHALDESLLTQMAETIKHRGPDHTGYLKENSVAFAMNRLSIIDLEGGFQPMHSSDGAVSLVFNGEIYNYRQLRREIEPYFHFKTQSDTEVILNGYCLWGADIFKRLNGIFAIALWDRGKHRVLLVRDPMGIKPYYYLLRDKKIFFSSELKTFTQLGLANQAASRGIQAYLAADYVFHPGTAIQDVRQLSPGELLSIDPQTLDRRTHIFRRPGDFSPSDLPADAHASKALIKQVLDESVIRQTVADVPYGILLSAGLDSMSILALLHRHQLTENLRSYTVYYPGDESFCENEPVAHLAQRWGFNNDLIPLTADDIRNHWDDICLTFDNLDLLPTAAALYVASQKAGTERRVLLAGNGGDELLFGYPTYRASRLVRQTTRLSPVLEKLLPALTRFLPASDDYLTWSEKLRRFAHGYSANPALSHVQWRHVFTHFELQTLLAPDYRPPSVEQLYALQLEHFKEGQQRGFTGALLDSWVDVRTWMVDSGLMMWDKAGMSGSVEIRVPILDLEFVDHVLALPEAIRTGGQLGTKALLKEIVADEVPADILALPKQGFQIPISSWLHGELKDLFHDLTASLPRAVFNPSAIDRLWREFEQGKGDHGLKLWSLGALAGWSSVHKVQW